MTSIWVVYMIVTRKKFGFWKTVTATGYYTYYGLFSSKELAINSAKNMLGKNYQGLKLTIDAYKIPASMVKEAYNMLEEIEDEDEDEIL